MSIPIRQTRRTLRRSQPFDLRWGAWVVVVVTSLVASGARVVPDSPSSAETGMREADVRVRVTAAPPGNARHTTFGDELEACGERACRLKRAADRFGWHIADGAAVTDAFARYTLTTRSADAPSLARSNRDRIFPAPISAQGPPGTLYR